MSSQPSEDFFFIYVSKIETFASLKLLYKQHMNAFAVHSRL